jgi:hypothetical protein
MKSQVITAFLWIMLLTACLPTATTTPDLKPATITQTDTPVPEKTFTPTATDSGLFEITEDHMVLQQGNTTLASLLIVKPSQALADNHIGLWYESYDRYYESDFVYTNGFKRMRIGGLFGSNQSGWPIRENTLSADVDNIISEYAENGVKIVLATHMGSGVMPIIDEFTQDDIDIILDYTNFIATHFKGRIAYYEIWNEFGHTEKINTYASLVEQSTELIKEIDPDAKVIIGAVPGDWLNEQPGYGEYQRFVVSTRYLNELIRITNFEEVDVDGISWHPLYDNIPEDPYYQEYPELVREIQEFASSRGFTGEYFADEILWHTYDEPDWDNGPPINQFISAKYYLRTITEHRGLGVNVTINTFFQVPEMAAIRNLNNMLAGAEPAEIDLLLETSEDVKYLRSYAFSLPDGSTLVAFWKNGAAVEKDHGVGSTLTIKNFSADNAIGIDVVHGFRQELTTETGDSDLIIRNLQIKDYPILIKLMGSTP